CLMGASRLVLRGYLGVWYLVPRGNQTEAPEARHHKHQVPTRHEAPGTRHHASHTHQGRGTRNQAPGCEPTNHGSSPTVHRPFDLIEQRHGRDATRRARLRLPALTDRTDELHVLAVECRYAVEWDILPLTVGHGVTIDLVGLLFANVAVKAAERSFVVEGH